MRFERVLWACVLLSACDGGTTGSGGEGGSGGSGASGGSGGEGAGPPQLIVVPGVPTQTGDEPDQASFLVEGYATAAASRGATAVVGTSVAVFGAEITGTTEFPIVGDEPDLAFDTGIVSAATPIETGVLIAAETGLYVALDGVLTRSNGHESLHPMGIVGMSTRLADDDASGEAEAYVVLQTQEGVVEWQSGETIHWTVGDETGVPSAALGQKDMLFAAWNNRVYEVDKGSQLGYPLVFDIGKVGEMACSSRACDAGSNVYFASDKGLVERSAGGQYVLYTLAPDGEPGVAVSGFALDDSKQRLYAVTKGGLLRVRAGHIPDKVSSLVESDMAAVATVEKSGDVWVFSGTSATRFATGSPLSFATDIEPIMGEYCAPCHKTGQNGAPKIDFEAYDEMVAIADKALMRIQDGSMPPATWPQVPKEKVQLIVDWITTKAP
ncbi:MAG: cytochrome c [Polyangiaceae bacterium]|nr:cytochrome c [Polyangiaceae bacterium]